LYAFEEHLVDYVRFADRFLAFTCFRNCGVMKRKNEFTNHNLFINAQFTKSSRKELKSPVFDHIGVKTSIKQSSGKYISIIQAVTILKQE
jgi:hypothetical protein